MKPKVHKSNINYHNHNRQINSLSNDHSNPSENIQSKKVLFDDPDSTSFKVINQKIPNLENSKNQTAKKNNFDCEITQQTEINNNNNNNFNTLKQSNLNDSRAVTASFYTNNNSLITNSKGIKQIRRNRYNKTYSQIQMKKTENSSKSNDEQSNNSNLNGSRRKNTHSTISNKNNNKANNNYKSNNSHDSNCEKKNVNVYNSLKPSSQKSFKEHKNNGFSSNSGTIDFDSKYEIRQNTQFSNFHENNNNITNYHHSLSNNTNNNINNTKQGKNKINLKLQNGNNNSNMSKSMNQDDLRNNLLKINLTSSLTPIQNFNMSSSIKNLLTETNKLNNDQNKPINFSTKAFINENISNNNINKQHFSSKSANHIEAFDSSKSLSEINFQQSPRSNLASNKINLSKRTNLRDTNTNNDLESQSAQAKMAFSNENFYKQKPNIKSIGTVNLPSLNRTDPKAFKAVKNQGLKINTISIDSPNYAEKGDLSQRNFYKNADNKSSEKALSLNNNSCFPQIKSVKFYEAVDSDITASADKLYDYPKRESNQNNNFHNSISSPTNSISNKIMPYSNNNNAASSPKQVSTNNASFKQVNNYNFASLEENNFSQDEIIITQSPNRVGYSYSSPKNKNEIAKQPSEYGYNHPRVSSNDFNATEGDQLTLIEEADEKIAGHISEENININHKDSSSNKNLVVIKKRSSDKSVHSKRKIELEVKKSAASAALIDKKSKDQDENKLDNFETFKEKTKDQIEVQKVIENKLKNNLENELDSKEVDSEDEMIYAENAFNRDDYKTMQQSEFIRNAKTADNFYKNNKLKNQEDNNLFSNKNSNALNTRTKKENSILKQTSVISPKNRTNYSFDNKANSILKSGSLKNNSKNIKKTTIKGTNKLAISSKSSSNSNAKNKEKVLSTDKTLTLNNDEETKTAKPNQLTSNNNIASNYSNLNKSNTENNLNDDSIYNKRNIIIEKYLANKSGKIEDFNNIHKSNNANMINLKTENIKKYINDQDDKISNFDNVNLNFSPNPYSRISMSSFRESCDFDLDKKFINSISNNDDFFSGDENKKPLISNKLINPKLLLNSMKNIKSTSKSFNTVNEAKKSRNKSHKQEYNNNNHNISTAKNNNFNKKNNNNAKSLSKSFNNALGNNSLLRNQLVERIETQNKNNFNYSSISKQNNNENNNALNKPNSPDSYKASTANKNRSKLNDNNHKRSISTLQNSNKAFSNQNPLNQSCGNLDIKNALQLGFNRIISKSTRGKNYYIKTENEDFSSEKKKKIFSDYELEIVPINNIILNYKEDVEDSFIEKFKKDLIMPANINSRLKNIFNKNKLAKQQITSKIEKRYFLTNRNFYNSASNFDYKNKKDLLNVSSFSPYNSFNLSPRNNRISKNFSDRILKFKEFKFIKTLSPKGQLISSMSFSPKADIYNANLNSFDLNYLANEKLNDVQSKNSFKKAIEKYNKFNEIKSKFDNKNSPDKNDLPNNNLLFYGSSDKNLTKNQNGESKNLKEIKKSLEQLNCNIEGSFTNSIKSPVNSKYFKTDADNFNNSTKKLLGNLTIDHNYNLNIDRIYHNLNINSTKNKALALNNFNFIYDMTNNKNNANSLNSINSFSFQQSPKNNSFYQSNNNNTINNPNLTNSPYKIAHPNVLSYIPDLISNNIELAEPFQNNIITKLINKNNSLNRSQMNLNNENDTLIVQNIVNETLTNSIKNHQKNNRKNTQNKLDTSPEIRSKSMGRTAKFIPEMLKKFNIIATNENSKSNNNNNNNYDKSNSKSISKFRDYSHDDILIVEDNNNYENNLIGDLKEKIKKIKRITYDKKLVKSTNTLDNAESNNLLSLNAKLSKNGINTKLKKLMEENKILLFDNLNYAADSEFMNNKHDSSKSKIKTKYSNSNINIVNEQKYSNTVSNINPNKVNHLRNRSKDLSSLDYNTSDLRNKSKLDLLRNKNENIKNLIDRKIPYILSEDNLTSNNINLVNNHALNKSSVKSNKLRLEDKINLFIENKIEENKELKSARYTNEKKLEDLNKKFNEKINKQFKNKKLTTEEDYKIVLDNIKHCDKASWKEFLIYKNKTLEQDIQISDEKLSEFKDKFFRNFNKEVDRDNINSYYKKLVTTPNCNFNANKDSVFENINAYDDNLFKKKPKIEEKIVTRNLEKLKILLNLEERNSREMKFYNDNKNNYNNNKNKNDFNLYSNKNFDYSHKNKTSLKYDIYSNNSNNNFNSYKYDSKFYTTSSGNETKNKAILGNKLKEVFQSNISGHSVLPKNDLGLDDLKMKKILHNNDYKFNF